MPTNEEKGTIIPAQSSLGLCGDTTWPGKVNPIDVLACADTVEDILPNNPITKYLKSNYETESLNSDGYADGDDESTINTLNTTCNTLSTLNITRLALDRSAPSFDNTLDQTIDCPFDEAIEVEISASHLPSHLEKPDYIELLGDLAENTFDKNDANRIHVASGDPNNTASTTINATLDSKSSLKFTAWIGEDAQDERKPSVSLPLLSPSPSSDNDDGTHISKTSGATKEGDKTICSNSTATDRSVEVIRRSIRKEKMKTIKEKKFEKESEAAREAREHRWEEMKDILKATAKIELRDVETSGSKKGALKKTLKRFMGSLRIGEKKANACINEEDDLSC